MSAINHAGTSRVEVETITRPACVPMADSAGKRLVQWAALVLAAASLAACAQSSVASRHSEFRQAALEPSHRSILYASHDPAAVPAKPRAFVPASLPAATHVASHGLASFYTEGTQTASGEKFDTYAMTAAHPSLPFGTRLRVTNVSTGRSVTVRVNDRGPFVRGRVVDVSYSAARALGMVQAGVANVKVDVVR
jgi:rare lipoprotein A